MYAIEFEADVQNGLIKICSQYKELDFKHLKIITLLDGLETIKPMHENKQFTDEYINDHWRKLLMTGLSNYNEAYYKRHQFKEDSGHYLMEIYK